MISAARRLHKGDISVLEDFFDQQSRRALDEKIISYATDQDELRAAYGFFSGEELLAVAAVYFMPRLPWASIVYLKNKTAPSAEKRFEALLGLVQYCFEEIEKRKCVRVYMANEMRKREGFLNAKLFPLVKKLPILQSYSFISEGFVKAGTRPQYAYQWQLMGEVIADQDFGFVSASKRI